MNGTYKRFTVRGISDKPECDLCGKTNLKLTIVLESECGELLHYGSDCAARTLRQEYRGKRHPVSREAAISMGKSAKRGESFATLSMQMPSVPTRAAADALAVQVQGALDQPNVTQ